MPLKRLSEFNSSHILNTYFDSFLCKNMAKYIIEKELRHHVIEWLATAFSITGALLVSLKIFQGYYIWVVANILWMSFAYKHKHYGLLTLSVCYFIISCIGIYNQFF